MKAKGAWTFRSFFICFAANAVLGWLLFVMADRVLDGLTGWVAPLVSPGAPALAEEARSALSNLAAFLQTIRADLAFAIATVLGAAAFFTWLLMLVQGWVMIGRAQKEWEEKLALRQAAPENPVAETDG